MGALFVGWDVGAWNCDRNRESRDALCVLEERDDLPAVVGTPSWGNLRPLLVSHRGAALVDQLLRAAGVEAVPGQEVTIAIDAALGWPRAMLELATAGKIVAVPDKADSNPYLFRAQDRALFQKGLRPLSAVRDMIGSQSTKGIHFLSAAELSRTSVGVWRRDGTVAVETYPAAAGRNTELESLAAKLMNTVVGKAKSHGDAWQKDVRDAVRCALVARLHHREPQRLQSPGTDADAAEGWIWLPA